MKSGGMINNKNSHLKLRMCDNVQEFFLRTVNDVQALGTAHLPPPGRASPKNPVCESLKAVILAILLLTLSLLPGCSEPEEPPGDFKLHIHNESGKNLYKRYFINDVFSGGPLWSESGAGANSASFTCPHRQPDFPDVQEGDPFTFKLVMEFRDQTVFAEGPHAVQCGDEFAAWVHPDGYIVFDVDGGRYSSPPW